ncbi:unnamed protein product [Ilex paraguariensis]|uniref:DUF4408 domain-containing protein n=1 Tax=Ilex paraguariensis TaxID=185542 RepID=A0ABC8S565_9AQUA
MYALDFDNVKVEKANAMIRYYRLRNLAKLFRIVEVCLILVFLSWSSTRLPFAVRLSGEYFRLLIGIIVSPFFIFLLSNAIVVVLVVNSGQFSGQTPSSETENNAETNLCEEFINSSDNRIVYGSDGCASVPEPEDIVYQDKQIISESNTSTIPKSDSSEVPAMVVDKVSEAKAHRRSQSENFERESSKENCGKLRRSVTEKCRNLSNSGDTPGETVHLVDKLSNEEFQQAIDEFIAKQVKFHREEKSAIVLHSQI